MSVLYAEGGKIYCNTYMEIYIPQSYFVDNIAVNNGASIQTLGILYTRAYPDGQEGPIKLFNVPVVIDVMVYEFRNDTIQIHGTNVDVMAIQYPKGSYVLHQTVTIGRELAEHFMAMLLGGKLPRTLGYSKLINIWHRNLEISGISFKVPSKIYEMVIAAIYRNPRNPKERFGQYYGRTTDPNEYDYKADNVRNVVKYLSTFSGITFEDIGSMITSGINNSLDGVEEPISPLEKIIHY